MVQKGLKVRQDGESFVGFRRTKMQELAGLILTRDQLSFDERKPSQPDGFHYFYVSDIGIFL